MAENKTRRNVAKRTVRRASSSSRGYLTHHVNEN
jgi:hypothetical protein